MKAVAEIESESGHKQWFNRAVKRHHAYSLLFYGKYATMERKNEWMNEYESMNAAAFSCLLLSVRVHSHSQVEMAHHSEFVTNVFAK